MNAEFIKRHTTIDGMVELESLDPEQPYCLGTMRELYGPRCRCGEPITSDKITYREGYYDGYSWCALYCEICGDFMKSIPKREYLKQKEAGR